MISKDKLDELRDRYNVPEFVASDPIQFPRRFSRKQDIEIATLLTATIAWGRRPMILRNADRLLAMLDNEPERFVLSGDIDAIPDANIHRTFFGRHLRYFLRGLRQIYKRYGSLEDFAVASGATGSATPSWHLTEAMNSILTDANAEYPIDGPVRCLPADVDKTALKRINMALRWLVRCDGIVDIGCWTALKPSQLYIPLDVHSGRVARMLGLLDRKQDDRRAAVELTEALRRFDPQDPVAYDFALFGAGVNSASL